MTEKSMHHLQPWLIRLIVFRGKDPVSGGFVGESTFNNASKNINVWLHEKVGVASFAQ